MSQSKPLTIILEFSDGLKAAASFDALPLYLRREILRQPFTVRPTGKLSKQNFLLLEWDDGWKEVIELDVSCTEINRYYVISRPEQVGRLSLNSNNRYPELVEISRRPLNLSKITFLDTFQLERAGAIREGKKTDQFFALAPANDAFTEALTSLKRSLVEEGIDRKALQSGDTVGLKEHYEKIRRRMGLRAAQRQQDVYDFITYLARAEE